MGGTAFQDCLEIPVDTKCIIRVLTGSHCGVHIIPVLYLLHSVLVCFWAQFNVHVLICTVLKHLGSEYLNGCLCP